MVSKFARLTVAHDTLFTFGEIVLEASQILLQLLLCATLWASVTASAQPGHTLDNCSRY